MEIAKLVKEIKNWCKYENYLALKKFQKDYNNGNLQNLDWVILNISITQYYSPQVFRIEDLLIILDNKCYIFDMSKDVAKLKKEIRKEFPQIAFLSEILKAREYNRGYNGETIDIFLSPKAKKFYKEVYKFICFSLYEGDTLPHYEDYESIFVWYFKTRLNSFLKKENPFSLTC